MKSIIKSIFALSFVGFFTSEIIHSMKPQNPRSIDILQRNLPDDLLVSLNGSLAVKSIKPFTEYLDKIIDIHGSHVLHLLVLSAGNKPENIKDRISRYIIHGFSLLDLKDHEILNKVLALNKLEDSFLNLAAKKGLHSLVIEVLKFLKPIMTEADFHNYFNPLLQQAEQSDVPFTQDQQVDILVLYPSRQPVVVPQVEVERSAPIPVKEDHGDGLQPSMAPENERRRHSIHSRKNQNDQTGLLNILNKLGGNRIILDQLISGQKTYEEVFLDIPLASWVSDPDEFSNHFIAQLIRIMHAQLNENLFSLHLPFIQYLIDQIAIKHHDFVIPHKDSRLDCGLWRINGSGEDILAMAILRGMHSLVFYLLELRKQVDPDGFKSYLEAKQKHHLLLEKAIDSSSWRQIITKRTDRNLSEDRQQLLNRLIDYYEAHQVLIPYSIKVNFPGRFPIIEAYQERAAHPVPGPAPAPAPLKYPAYVANNIRAVLFLDLSGSALLYYLDNQSRWVSTNCYLEYDPQRRPYYRDKNGYIWFLIRSEHLDSPVHDRQ